MNAPTAVQLYYLASECMVLVYMLTRDFESMMAEGYREQIKIGHDPRGIAFGAYVVLAMVLFFGLGVFAMAAILMKIVRGK